MGKDFRALVLLGAGTGLRAGELFGLQVGDVDFLRRLLTVHRQVQEVSGRLVVGQPKTPSSQRTVPVPELVLQALAAHIESHPPGPDGWVFGATDGKPLRRTNFMRSHWTPAARRAGIPSGVALHALRHYYASVLIAGGLSVKVVAERLGHTNAAMTLNVYSHLFPDDEDRTRQVVEQALTNAATDVRRTSTSEN